MKKRTNSKSKSSPPRGQSEQVYGNRGPTNPRALGSTLNHDHPAIPSSTFRTMEQSVPRSQMRTDYLYDWNPKTGKGRLIEEPVDLMDHARQSITDAKFISVTSGYRQRYHREEDKRDRSDTRSGTMPAISNPSPLGGRLGSRRKEKY